MPRGDGTGPGGMGPMTGRAAGYCAGFDMPGFANPAPAMGMGWGGRGRGRGWRRGYYATGVPGWARARYAAPWPAPAQPWPEPTEETQLQVLRSQADALRQQLEAIDGRIASLEADEE